MKVNITLLLLIFSLNGFGQRVVDRPIVYQVPEMAAVTVKSDLTFKAGPSEELHFDIFYPPNYQQGQQLPVVVFANGGIKALSEWPVYQDWARLMAAHGMIAILHQSTRESRFEDLGDLLDHLAEKGRQHGIDGDRMAIWACSGNVTAAYPQLMAKARSYLRCAVFYYGMPSNITPPRQDLPLLLVRAGLDSYSLNTKIDEFIPMALLEDIPLEFINYLEGYHAFDVLNDTDASRKVIQRTVAYLREHLNATVVDPSFTLTTRNFYKMIKDGQQEIAFQQMKQLHQQVQSEGNPHKGYYRVADQSSINTMGYQLIQESLTEKAIAVMQLNVELFPDSPNAYDSLADAFEADQQPKKALLWANRTLEKLESSNLSDNQRKGIEDAAQDKINRLDKG